MAHMLHYKEGEMDIPPPRKPRKPRITLQQLHAICVAAVPVLDKSRFTAGNAMRAMYDAVQPRVVYGAGTTNYEPAGRPDCALVWLIADGLQSAAHKLREYCLYLGYEPDEEA